MADGLSIPELPPGLVPDPTLVEAHRAPPLLRRIDLQRKWTQSSVSADRESIQQDLSRMYPPEDLRVVVQGFRDRIERFGTFKDRSEEEAWLYKRYLGHYNRYGGTQKCLTWKELDQAKILVSRGIAASVLSLSLSAEERRRIDAAAILALTHAPLFDGLVPDNPPPEQVPLEIAEETHQQIRQAVEEAPKKPTRAGRRWVLLPS